MSTAPYVSLEWNDGSQGRAMVDTGADWSLIAEEGLTAREKLAIRPSSVRGRGVSREEIPVLGEIFRTLRIGNVTVPDQRFVVVRGLIVPAILGIDFWSRLGSLKLDLQRRRLVLEEWGAEFELFSAARPERDSSYVDLKLRRDVTIPPATEALVQVYRGDLQQGEEYLVEPVGSEESPVSASYCVVTATDDDAMWIKVANIGATQEVLRRGEVVAHATTDVSVGGMSQPIDEPRHNESPFKIGDELTDAQRSDIVDLLAEYGDVFYAGGELPVVRVNVEHRINIIPGTRPVALRPRRLSPRLEKEVRQELNQLEAMGVIRESHSPWAAPVVCARRKDGRLRLAIDYRRVNAVSAAATLHPIPLMEDLVDRLADAKYFSVLDAKSGYHQLPLHPADSEVTAFVVPWGHYEWAERTPFGLHGAGFSFQRLMSAVLGESNFTEAICYLDDILVWSVTWEQHVQRLRSVLEKIRQAGLALSPEKCQFGKRSVEYLGTVISDGRISMSASRVQHLRDLPPPRDVHELRRALGSFAYVQRWIPGVAETARPLYDALEKDGKKKLNWTESMASAFNMLKQQVSDAVALHLPDFNKPFVLVTDASNTGTGAMLANRDGQHLKPLGFFHHALSHHEMKYSTTEKELLAVVLAVKRFRIYLSNGPFSLITDHRALRWLNSLDADDERGRRGRWIDFLQQFQINPVHKAGKHPDMTMADYLSRVGPNGDLVACVQAGAVGLEPDLTTTVFTIDQLRDEQRMDPQISPVRAALLGKQELSSKSPESARTLYRFRRHLSIGQDGLLRYLFNGGRNQLPVIPRAMRPEALRIVHDAPLSGHMGRDRTWKRARNAFWWPNMKLDVSTYVSGCEMCGQNKLPKTTGQAPLQHTDLPSRPLAKLQVDFAGPFPQTDAHPYRYVFQIQDIFSRYLMLLPAQDCTADTAASLLFNHWICTFDVPIEISSDRGSHFTAETFRALCRRLEIRHILGTPLHPQGQGQVERQNQLLTNLRCMCSNDVRVWPTKLSQLQFSHNTAVNASTGFSPFELLFARPARRPEACISDPPTASSADPAMTSPSPADEVTQRRQLLDQLHRQAQVGSERAQAERIENSAVRARGQPFEVGDYVRLRLTAAERGKKGGKMSPVLSPLYQVVEVLRSGWAYRLKKVQHNMELSKGTRNEKIRHFNDLVRSSAGPTESEVRRPVVAVSDDDDDSETSSSSEDEAHTERDGQTRQRDPPERLIVEPSRKSYRVERIRRGV